MSTITLPNIRVGSDLQVRVRLKDGGVAIDWSTLQNIKACIYSDAQRALAGRCSISIDAEDSTLLVCNYAANKPQYLGANRVVISVKYLGETKTYDKPAFTFVRWTDDQAGEQITIDDPDVDVEIDVEDVSSSILDEAIRAAFAGAERANDAADSLAGVEADVEAAEALRVAAEESRVEAEEDRVEAEAARVDEEAVRVSAEDARVVAENAREAAEDLREGAEDDRAAAETARETAEAARVAAEALRVSAEGSRESAEAARASQASADHATAASDHTQAAADHTQAASDHTTAASDHTQASSDHTQAAADHTTAAADHTQAQADHAVMEGYDDRLDSVESEVSQLEAKVDDLKNDVDLKIDGVGTAEKDIIWTDGYANYAKKITAQAQSQFSQPVLLKRGETILYKSSKEYSSAIVSVPNDNPVSIGDTLSGDTLLVYGAQKIGTTEQYTATSDIYIVISVSKADREISFLAYNENSVVSQIEKVRDELPLNLENRGVCDKFDGYTAVTNNYITLLQGHKYRFTIEFKHTGTLGGSANLKLVSADSLASVKLLISLGGQTISENQKISEDLLWTDASVENYRLAFYDTLAAGITALKDAIVTAKDVSTDTLLDWMAESGKYPLTKVGFLSVHNNNVKIDFTSSTIVIPAYTRVIYKVSGNSYSATSNVATTLQRDANYEQIICFNETSKEFVARGISGVQDDDYILFVIQNSAGKDRTTLSPSLYTIDGKAPFVMQSEGLYKTAQVLSDSEKTQVLTNLGIVWTKNGPTVSEGFVSYPSKYGSVPKVSSGTDAFAITGVDLVKGHTYEAKIVAENTITAPSDFNLKICNNTSGSTIYRIMTLGGLTFSEKTARFVWENETVGDYRVGFYGNGTVNTKIEVFLKDVSVDAVNVTPVVDLNRHKEAALISVASKSGNENIKVANKLTLLHFSDVHGNTANLANIVTYGDHYSDLLDDIIHTGDSVHTQMSDTNPFVSVEGAENILNVIGNHEAWLNTSDPDYYATEKQTYDKIFAPSIANWGVVQPAGAADNGYCYYYKDFTTAGFRLIVLDTVHWHYRSGVSQENAAQKTWFEGVLADAITNNLRVVCATHYTPQNGIVPVENTGFNVLGTTAGANIADGWYAVDEIYGCVDTFIGNGGKFMGWIVGHTHEDYFGTVRNHTGQPIVVIGTSKGSGSANNKFITDTVAQDNFNVITFENLNSKDYIKIVKIGQDTDIYTRSKKTICYNFTDGVLISTT